MGGFVSRPRAIPVFEAPDGARERMAALVSALRRPDAYSSAVPRVEAVETHMSWVFLTEVHAYKLKKPIRTDRLDHTTPRLRRLACEAELELNRRLAPDVYLDVVGVAMDDEGRVCVGGGGPVIDWLVKMRRLPRDCMLDAHIERGDLDPMELLDLGRVLARFYRSLAPEPASGKHYRARLSRDIENAGATLQTDRYGLPTAPVAALATAQQQWIDRHASLLEERAATIVEAHGDLRPEHVCLEATPAIIDCLEFDRSLRLLDPVSELSFLALECHRLGAPDAGMWILEGYAEESDDAPPPELVDFYRSFHALVRATVAIWHLDDHAVDGDDVWRARALTYIALGGPFRAR